MQKVHKQPSCLAHPFCTDGSSVGFLSPSLQTDSGNRNTQWFSVLCQYCWRQPYHLSTCEIYTDAFSVFIAWLNLDFGIETCFFDGMDAYSKTWLQFVFPVYIWVLVRFMILFSHYSQRFANLLGNNPVSVLAILILLSYAKFLRTLIAATSFATLDYPHNFIKSVWLYDANVDCIISKHISLFLVAMLVFLFLFLPYTLLLVFGQWLQGMSHLRFFSWVNSARLKPFMDSYHAPYKPTGLDCCL